MSDEQKRAAPSTTFRDPRDPDPRRRTPEDPLEALTAIDPEGPPAEIPLDRLDIDALKVVQRLRSYGHQAYLVGGCVRDLSLDLQPKDFDVATSAHPGEIRAIFRNCRLIGRRFRLAHIYFKGGKVVETATFRANPHEDLTPEQANGDLLITRDNVFGTAEEDARRRDFTINGLFYDFVLGRIIDYVGGREDLRKREIRTIGDPDVRMREDPVRLLRAIRFAAKLDFAIERRTWEAMVRNRGEIARCAPPRVLEEIFRLLRSGYSRRCFELLRDLGALPVLLPPLATWLERSSEEEGRALFTSLDLLDEVVRHGPMPDDAVLLSILLLHLQQHELVKHPARRQEREKVLSEEGLAVAVGDDADTRDGELDELEALEHETDEEVPLPEEPAEGETHEVPWSLSANVETVEELLAELVRSARLPRRIAERARLILHAQRILSGVRKRRSSPAKFVRQPFFPEALQVFELYVKATGHGADALARWKSRGAPPAQVQGLPVAERPAAVLSSDVEVDDVRALETGPAAVVVAGLEEGLEAIRLEERRGKKRRGGRRGRHGQDEAVFSNGTVVEGGTFSLESIPPEGERGPVPGPAELLPF